MFNRTPAAVGASLPIRQAQGPEHVEGLAIPEIKSPASPAAAARTGRLLRRSSGRHRALLLGFALTGSLFAVEPRQTAKEAYAMKLTSPAFGNGQPIPGKHTCDGADVSPPLSWSEVPPGTRSFALICDDPDAPVGTWVHWVIYNLAPTTAELLEMVASTEQLPGGAKQGLNDFRRVGYGGPCPPPGRPHRYLFKLYALDTELALRSRATKADVVRAMDGHILAEAQLMGTYQRAR
jgi:Raf kinase inhibitor-like YbhB/YbcL family protein